MNRLLAVHEAPLISTLFFFSSFVHTDAKRALRNIARNAAWRSALIFYRSISFGSVCRFDRSFRIAYLRECSAGKVNLDARKYLTGKAALFNDLPAGVSSLHEAP